MAELRIPTVKCTERIYEILCADKVLTIKSKQSVSHENTIDELIKEEQELLNFINKYEILETSKVSVTPQTIEHTTIIETSPLTEIELSLPKEEDVINYITSKQGFEFHTVELQEKFLGRRVMVRDNPKLYNAFDSIIRGARKWIANKHNGIWDNRTTKSLGGKTHVTVYRFLKKPTEEPTSRSLFELDAPNNLHMQKLIPLTDYKRKEPAITQ